MRAVALTALVVAGFFALCEAVLFGLGVSTLADERDPFQGFSRRSRVFERRVAEGVYQTVPSALRSFNLQRFLMDKPDAGFRFFALGGSSVYGFPWGAEAAFPRLLGDALRGAWPDRVIEDVNVGGMSYASHRLRILSHELLGYEPDLLILYGGHNEYVERSFYREHLERRQELDALRSSLHRTRLYSAMTRVFLALSGPPDRPVGSDLGFAVIREDPGELDEALREQTRRRFEENIRSIVVRAAADGVAVVLCTVPSNLRSWRPEQSRFAAGTSAAVRRRVREGLATAEEALARGDAAVAIAEVERASALAPEFAEASYRLGRAYEAAGRHPEAVAAFARARDTDASPTRAPSALNASLRRLARELGVPLVDAERVFERAAAPRAPGFDEFEDYVHPNRAGHALIASALFRALGSERLLGEPQPAADFQSVLETGRKVRHAGSASVPTPGASVHRAAMHFNLGVVLANRGEVDAAIAKYREALDENPGYAAAELNIGLLEAERGDDRAAVEAYRRALRPRPDHPRTLMALGESLRSLGRLPAAEAAFDRATRSAPETSRAWYFLGLVRFELGKYRSADEALDEAERLAPREANSRWIRGLNWLAQERWDEAEASFAAALERHPGHRGALIGWADLERRRGNPQAAAELYRRVLAVHPENERARKGLSAVTGVSD